jgi:hypothetical protein
MVWSAYAVGVVLFLLQFFAQEIGYWAGRRHAAQSDVQREGVGVVVSSLLGLLAFVLALTLSLASSQFAERRAGTLAEANAIGTAWLRAEAIPHPRTQEIARLLESYTRERIAYVRANEDPAELDRINQRTSALQARSGGMRRRSRRNGRTRLSPRSCPPSTRPSAATATRFAHGWRIPPQVLWLLIVMALLCAASLGFQLGLKGREVSVLVALLTALWTIVIVDILDLASPRIGNFRSSTAVYEWTLSSFATGVQIPATPSPR